MLEQLSLPYPSHRWERFTLCPLQHQQYYSLVHSVRVGLDECCIPEHLSKHNFGSLTLHDVSFYIPWGGGALTMYLADAT